MEIHERLECTPRFFGSPEIFGPTTVTWGLMREKERVRIHRYAVAAGPAGRVLLRKIEIWFNI
jgi:hypothetical protein